MYVDNTLYRCSIVTKVYERIYQLQKVAIYWGVSTSELSNTVRQDCCMHLRVNVPKYNNYNAEVSMSQKVHRRRLSVAGERIKTITSIGRDCWKRVKIIHEIYIPLNFSIRFWWIHLIFLNSTPVKFHLSNLCINPDIYVTNFFPKSCVYIYIFIWLFTEL